MFLSFSAGYSGILAVRKTLHDAPSLFLSCRALIIFELFYILGPSRRNDGGHSAGCCSGMGGFNKDGEDYVERMEREDREKAFRKSGGADPNAGVQTTQPTAAPTMTVTPPPEDTPAAVHEISEHPAPSS